MPCMKRGVKKDSEDGAGPSGSFAAHLHMLATR